MTECIWIPSIAIGIAFPCDLSDFAKGRFDDLNVNLLHGNFTSAVENVRIHVCLDVTYAKFSEADASSSCTISRRSVRTVKCLTQNIFIWWYSMISSMCFLVKGRKEKTSIYCKYCVTLKNLRKIWCRIVLDVFTTFPTLSGLGGSKRIWWESKEFQLRWGLRTLSGVPWCLQWGQAEPLLSSSRPARSRRKLQCQRRFQPLWVELDQVLCLGEHISFHISWEYLLRVTDVGSNILFVT